MENGLAYMAECFVVEFARMGYSEEGLLAVFRDPFYQGPYMAYREYGEDWVRALIHRTVSGSLHEEGERV